MSSTKQNFLNKKPCTSLYHHDMSTNPLWQKNHHTPPIFPPSSQGALAGAALPLPLAPGIPTKSSCLYVFLGKLLMAWANNPNKRFFSKISPWYFYLNQQCNNPNLKHLNKMSAWMSPFPFWMSPRITLPIQSPPNQPKTNLKCYPFAVREKGMFLLVTSQTFVFRDVLIWSYVRPEHWLKLIWKSFDTLFLGCQMALWKRRI